MSDVEDDDEATGTDGYKPSFVLFAIDTDPSMFIKREDGESTSFKDCINACYDLANSLIFTQNKRSWSPFGVVLALEDASASFVNFNDNILDSIKFLKDKTKLSEDELKEQYQRKGSFDLSAFFLFCKKKFKEVSSVFYKRTIVYITNDDNPVRNDNAQRFAALNEAKNFEANSISFEMVTMNPDFDYKIFYNELFSVMKIPAVETIIEDQEGLLEKLSSLVVMRFRKRKLNFFPFYGDQGRFLRVVQKAFIREEKIYNNAFTSADGKPLKKIPRTAEGGMKTFRLKHNASGLEFDLEENIEILNNNLPVGYTLVHVSDRVTEIGSVLKNTVILDVDPKEELPFFDSFWQYCVDKNKVLVCARKLKHNDKLRFVEFIPKFANNAKIFIIKTIPFNDENKYPPSKLVTEENVSANYSQEKLKVVNELINSLTFDYHPKMFTNPASAKKKAFLRSKLLDEPKEDVEDVTLDTAGIDKSLGQIGEDFKKLFHLDEETSTKRKGASTSERSKKKKK